MAPPRIRPGCIEWKSDPFDVRDRQCADDALAEGGSGDDYRHASQRHPLRRGATASHRRGIHGHTEHVIDWVPDTWTLLELQRIHRPKRITAVIYPGDGLPQVELERLRDVFPKLNLYTFEEAAER